MKRRFARQATTNGVPIPGTYHEGIEIDGVMYEMGPDGGGNVHVYNSKSGPEGLLTETQKAMDSLIWGETRGNAAAMRADIENTNTSEKYQWWNRNNNAWSRGIVSRAGGDPSAGRVWTPAFVPGQGPVPYLYFGGFQLADR